MLWMWFNSSCWRIQGFNPKNLKNENSWNSLHLYYFFGKLFGRSPSVLSFALKCLMIEIKILCQKRNNKIQQYIKEHRISFFSPFARLFLQVFGSTEKYFRCLRARYIRYQCFDLFSVINSWSFSSFSLDSILLDNHLLNGANEASTEATTVLMIKYCLGNETEWR